MAPHPRAIAPGSRYAFVSYSRTDRDLVRRLRAHLEAHDVIVWHDDAIEHGERWAGQIAAAIDGCAVVVVVVSPAACESDFVEKEILQAQGLRKPILPLRLRGRRHFLLNNIQDEDVRGPRLPSRAWVEHVRDLTGVRSAMAAPVQVDAWGNANFGRIAVPAGLTDVTAVAAGFGHTLALHCDGYVTPWGTCGGAPAEVPRGLAEVTVVAAGFSHSLALHHDGRVTPWGTCDGAPATVPPSRSDVIAIAAGSEHSLFLHRDGHVSACGRHDQGQATVPAGLTDVVAIAAGSAHSLALRRDGRIIAWGRDNYGQCTGAKGLTDVVAIAAGFAHSLALYGDGRVKAWGRGDHSEAAKLVDVKAVAAGHGHSLALHSDGHISAWGDNQDGQATVPARLAGTTAIAIASGSDHNVVILRADP